MTICSSNMSGSDGTIFRCLWVMYGVNVVLSGGEVATERMPGSRLRTSSRKAAISAEDGGNGDEVDAGTGDDIPVSGGDDMALTMFE